MNLGSEIVATLETEGGVIVVFSNLILQICITKSYACDITEHYELLKTRTNELSLPLVPFARNLIMSNIVKLFPRSTFACFYNFRENVQFGIITTFYFLIECSKRRI